MPGENQYSRLEAIIGKDGLEKLFSSKIMVVGVGGVGSNCIEALARGAVGNLWIVDGDKVCESNINRQTIAFHSTLGLRKVDVMRQMIFDIDPNINVTCVDKFLSADDVLMLLGDAKTNGVNFIVDAVDTVTVKIELAVQAYRLGIKIISSMGGGGKLNPNLLQFSKIEDTYGCPLCRVVRKELRKRGISDLEVLFSPESRHNASGLESDRRNFGTMSYFPPIMGQMLAGKVIHEILGM